jgi:hypothetical protein
LRRLTLLLVAITGAQRFYFGNPTAAGTVIVQRCISMAGISGLMHAENVIH